MCHIFQWQIQDFPLGGSANLRHVHFSVKTYVKMKEMDPVGGVPAVPPLDPPMPFGYIISCLGQIFITPDEGFLLKVEIS